MIRECCHDFRHQPLSSATLYKGLENFNILIVQEFVYNSLSNSYRDMFTEIDLTD
jgi:hypothetical protein